MEIKNKYLPALWAAVILLGTASPVFAAEPGWKQEFGAWTYIQEDGKPVVSAWKQIGSNWYYFGKDGHMHTGFLTQDKKTYYMDASGAMKKGWLNKGGLWYAFGNDGIMITGWHVDAGNHYFLDSSTGAMKTGWLKQGNDWYYLDHSGAMKKGWLLDESGWHFLGSDGKMCKDVWIQGKDDGGFDVVQYIDKSGLFTTIEYGAKIPNYWLATTSGILLDKNGGFVSRSEYDPSLDQPQTQPGTQPTTPGAQPGSTPSTVPEKEAWKTAYLKQAQIVLDTFKKDNKSEPVFALFQVDGDDVPEMLILDTSGYYNYSVYTWKNGELKWQELGQAISPAKKKGYIAAYTFDYDENARVDWGYQVKDGKISRIWETAVYFRSTPAVYIINGKSVTEREYIDFQKNQAKNLGVRDEDYKEFPNFQKFDVFKTSLN